MSMGGFRNIPQSFSGGATPTQQQGQTQPTQQQPMSWGGGAPPSSPPPQNMGQGMFFSAPDQLDNPISTYTQEPPAGPLADPQLPAVSMSVPPSQGMPLAAPQSPWRNRFQNSNFFHGFRR